MLREYMQQAPVLYGEGAISKLGAKVLEFNCKKVFLIYDAGVKFAGIAEKAIHSLEEAEVEYVVYDDVTGDPPDFKLDEAGKLAKEAGVDCIVGIGGGSSLDTAKAVSLLQNHEPPISQYLNLEGPPFTLEGGVPTILVPTTAGTGSEVTRMCIVTHTGVNVKIPIFTHGSLAILDPELCKTAPLSITAFGGLDALAHASESITCINNNPYSDTLALEAIRRIAKYLPTCCTDPGNMEARSNMSIASNFAGIAFSATDVQIGHAAADSISASYHGPHGMNCALVTPPVQELMATVVPDRVRMVAEALGVELDGTETNEELGKKTADAIRALMKACSLKSMEELGYDRDVIINEGAKYTAANVLTYNCPVPMTEEIAAEILRSAYDDYK